MMSPERIVFQLPQQIHLDGFDLLLKKEIGRGGFGSVYLIAYEGIDYAAKLYRMWEILPDEREDILQRIYQEYQISEKIESPHVVKMLAYQEIYGNPFLIMEFCEGGSLRNVIGKRLSFDEVLKIVKDICLGLHAMHEEGIVHRDIKPENILLKDKEYCITDFGISANLNRRITQTDIRGRAKQVFATAAYSPPEQASGALAYKSIGPTNDIYALGVLLYEILTLGKLPYGSFEAYENDPISYEAKKKNESWDQQSLFAAQAAPLWIDIIQQCLRTKPAERFQNTDEILNVLPTENPPASYPQRHIHNISSCCLEVVEGDQKGLVFFISRLAENKGKKKLTIGRWDKETHYSNDVLINERDKDMTSRFHATLEQFINEDGSEQWLLRDGQWISLDGKMQWNTSTNGTYVNDRSIGKEGVLLLAEDIIKIGRTSLKFSTS
ncbi:FHA domain-containing serine/threonine-protein kinase [Catalinimonas niigatensis]|uniref:FHA domain-containing serine/threonine-protein kinase n=1 Tax=Catalinimonas niigatensis TaxID=1397264 RepID=UPI0026656CDD|nr:FHA domain-containing serine/threonine-protein kinase [Catalinimonas niigatensis]WPP49132.1 FHA domain-containing serine/threonine-protein kinase [Catalinimonas niigatensis]